MKYDGRPWLWVEFFTLFLGLPSFFILYPSRWNIHLAMWCVAVYALVILKRQKDFSWHELWNGQGWPMAQRKMALLRFGFTIPLIILLTYTLVPQYLFSFPLRKPMWWVVVMVLYPILSVLPQELVFRSFFFRRYQALFTNDLFRIAVSALVFGFVHLVFHNPVSPTLSAIGGLIFASSYHRHRSLKWAAIEHAAYGCMVFTVGIGTYFLVGGYRS